MNNSDQNKAAFISLNRILNKSDRDFHEFISANPMAVRAFLEICLRFLSASAETSGDVSSMDDDSATVNPHGA